ncbi:MAG: S46 family peptidase [Gammaproteobacteria bacterium]|nr:S46 family peptidase [Gammaproteobacteria bacterium]MYD01809.1 S46 family peptidase [Gammaproteobacteria bacterium]MYI25251.1 S46 family peptidase [Gammaproteobacteria bacterium]
MSLRQRLITIVFCLSCGPFAGDGVLAKEGMFTPEQIPGIAGDLRDTGLNLDPATLADLTAFPMGAVISLGGCTASFVSPNGLVVTNHHCARGSVQFNSTSENNYLEDGFLAASPAEELPAAPGSRIYVTLQADDVTAQVTGGLDPALAPRERFAKIEQRRKALIRECESEPGYRCQAASFFGGLQYKLIRRLEIRDARIAYSPADAIGKYGGDIDNWRWPRHTGDFAFYRAYVGPDGQPADYAEENVPYSPPHFLEVSASGLEDGDFVMAMGYPGSTSRYARLASVRHTFDWQYPEFVRLFSDWIATIEAAAPEGSEARIRYASRLAQLNNVLKNLKGQIDGARRNGLAGRRAQREADLNDWIAADPHRIMLGQAIEELDALSEERAAEAKRGYWYGNALRPQLLSAALRLYRLAHERGKPDAARESGYQQRDMAMLRQRMSVIDRRFDPAVDKAEWMLFLKGYLAQPADMRIEALDEAMGLSPEMSDEELSEKLDGYYEDTVLNSLDTRLALMDASPEELDGHADPFIRLAAALHETQMEREEAAKVRSGRANLLNPQYMRAIINWQQSRGHAAYPDANSTLRVTYGTVMGGSPADGLLYEPFTRLEGIVQKDTGEEPFNSPAAQLDLIRAGDYGGYYLDSIGSVPVNFLSDLDSTGGNSGSATLDADGKLVGLLFDGTLESVNSDWDFDPDITRTIHVDTRYMLWVMEKVDGASALIEEMTIVP